MLSRKDNKPKPAISRTLGPTSKLKLGSVANFTGFPKTLLKWYSFTHLKAVVRRLVWREKNSKNFLKQNSFQILLFLPQSELSEVDTGLTWIPIIFVSPTTLTRRFRSIYLYQKNKNLNWPITTQPEVDCDWMREILCCDWCSQNILKHGRYYYLYMVI